MSDDPKETHVCQPPCAEELLTAEREAHQATRAELETTKAELATSNTGGRNVTAAFLRTTDRLAAVEANLVTARGLLGRVFATTKHFSDCVCVTCEDARAFLSARPAVPGQRCTEPVADPAVAPPETKGG